MKSFKYFINEVLDPEQEKEVAGWSKRTLKATKATDPFFGKGVEDKHEPLANTQDKSEIHQKIEKHLGKTITPEEYKTGKMNDVFGRQVRIGAVLGKSKVPSELARGFENDTTRQSKSQSGLTVRTTRSPSGVAGQTSGNQSWEQESCKNIDSGCNRHYLPAEVKHGTVVSYLHDPEGKELARTTFQPFHNKEGHTLYKQDSYYGVKHAGFMAHNKKTEEALTGEHKGGSIMYNINKNVYNNAADASMVHPKATEADVNKEIETNGIHDVAMNAKEPRIQKIVLAHPAMTTNGLAYMTRNTTNPETHKAILNHPKIVSPILESMARNTTNPDVHKAILNHPLNNPTVMNTMGASATNPETHKAIMNHPLVDDDILNNIARKTIHPEIHKAILNHPLVRDSVLLGTNALRILNNIADTSTDENIQREILKHPSVNSGTLSQMANNTTNPEIHKAILNHPKATVDQYYNQTGDVLQAISHHTDNKDVEMAIANHPNATTNVLSALASNSSHPEVHNALVNNPKIDDYGLGKLADKPDTEVARKAMNHPNAESWALKSVAHHHPELHGELLQHPKTGVGTLNAIVSHPNPNKGIITAALNHPAANSTTLNAAIITRNPEAHKAISEHPMSTNNNLAEVAAQSKDPEIHKALLKHQNAGAKTFEYVASYGK